MRGQREQTALFRVIPDIGGFTLAWTGYGSGGNSATYGGSAPVVDAPATTPVLTGVSYAWSATGEACSVATDTGALTIVSAGSCEVT